MQNLWLNMLFLLGRYLHIVCTTLLVGGTLFYEMVVPVAIGDLRSHEQLAVFARARWMFRSIVWSSGILLLLSGVLTTRAHWEAYTQERGNSVTVVPALAMPAAPSSPAASSQPAGSESIQLRPVNVIVANSNGGTEAALRPGWWWAAHASTGVMAVLIAMGLTAGGSPPQRPVGWMRINLVVLLIVMFLATATRQLRLADAEHRAAVSSLGNARPAALVPHQGS